MEFNEPDFFRAHQRPTLTLLVSLLLATAANVKFWSTFVTAIGGVTLARLPLLLGAFAIIVLFFNAVLTLVSFRFVAKPVLIALLLTASAATYFLQQYGVLIDKAMIQMSTAR
jgi:lipid A ethanolaminephosphotransferase